MWTADEMNEPIHTTTQYVLLANHFVHTLSFHMIIYINIYLRNIFISCYGDKAGLNNVRGLCSTDFLSLVSIRRLAFETPKFIIQSIAFVFVNVYILVVILYVRGCMSYKILVCFCSLAGPWL